MHGRLPSTTRENPKSTDPGSRNRGDCIADGPGSSSSAAAALNQLADVSAKQVEEKKKTEEDAIRDQIEGDAQLARQVARELAGRSSCVKNPS